MVPRKMRFPKLFLFIVLGGGVALADSDWNYAKTENFEIISSAGKRETDEIVGELGVFHDTMLQFLGGQMMSRQPTRIVIFNRQRDFLAYFPESDEAPSRFWHTVARSMSGPEGAIIAINAEANWRASRHAVQKVYGHLLLKNLEMNTPPWFDQGLARLFASFEIGRDQMMLGRARADEVGFFQLARKRNWDWLAWDEFFGKNYSGSRQFDSQAWLLLHYCFLSSERAQSWRVGILQLAFEAQMGNSDYPALLQRYLGVDFAGLQEELERYARKVNFPAVDLPLPENFKRGKLDYSNLAPEVLTEVLWELKVRSGRHEGLAELLAQGINETQRARRWELFGLLAFVQNDADTAFERWDRAIELGSSNGFIHRARAEAGLAGVLKIGPSSHPLNPAKVDEWRASLLRSLEAEPEDLRAIQWLACLEALAPEPDVANVNRVQRAVGELPRPYLTYLAVAWIRYQLGDRQTAASIVASLKPWTNWEYAQWVSALEFELETASTE